MELRCVTQFWDQLLFLWPQSRSQRRKRWPQKNLIVPSILFGGIQYKEFISEQNEVIFASSLSDLYGIQTFKPRCWRATTTTWKKPPTGTGRSIREHWRQTGEKKGISTKQRCAQKSQDDGSTYFIGHQIDHFGIFENEWDCDKRKLDSKCTFDRQISQTTNCTGFTIWV